MSLFPATRAATLAGETIRADTLLLMDWLPTPSRYWMGFGELRTTDGNVWGGTQGETEDGEGTDSVISIEGLEYALGTAAPKATVTVSAVDPAIITLARGQATLVKGRALTVYQQFFDASWAPLDAPYPVWTGLMDVMSFRSTRDGVYRVSVSVEGLWTRRNRPSAGYYDAQDQAARGFIGDAGLNQIPALAGQTILWKTT